MTTATHDPEAKWLEEDALDFRKRVHRLRDRIMQLRDAEAEAKERWKRCVQERKKAQLELEQAIENDREPNLFNRPQWRAGNGEAGPAGDPAAPEPVIERDLGKVLEAESDADALAYWHGVTADQVERSFIAGLFQGSDARPAKARPFRTKDGTLWVATGRDDLCWQVRPLLAPAEFAERYPGYPVRNSPHLPRDANDEDLLQFYTGVALRAGREKRVIAPAGEGRTVPVMKG